MDLQLPFPSNLFFVHKYNPASSLEENDAAEDCVRALCVPRTLTFGLKLLRDLRFVAAIRRV